jgi:hypothetical protein
MRLSWAQFGHKAVGRLLNHIRPLQERLRDRQPERFRGLEIDH